MAKYLLEMRFSYTIETDDIEATMREFEFPLFPLEDDCVEFLDNINSWEEVSA